MCFEPWSTSRAPMSSWIVPPGPSPKGIWYSWVHVPDVTLGGAGGKGRPERPRQRKAQPGFLPIVPPTEAVTAPIMLLPPPRIGQTRKHFPPDNPALPPGQGKGNPNYIPGAGTGVAPPAFS